MARDVREVGREAIDAGGGFASWSGVGGWPVISERQKGGAEEVPF